MLYRIAWVMICLAALAACGNPPPESFSSLPPGSAERGADLFRQHIRGAPPCSTCHQLTGEDNAGPGLAGIGERAAGRVNGQSAEEYLFTSIMRPNAYLVDGYSNLMYLEYSRRLSEQQIADLIAFLLTL